MFSLWVNFLTSHIGVLIHHFDNLPFQMTVRVVLKATSRTTAENFGPKYTLQNKFTRRAFFRNE